MTADSSPVSGISLQHTSFYRVRKELSVWRASRLDYCNASGYYPSHESTIAGTSLEPLRALRMLLAYTESVMLIVSTA